GRGVGTLVPEPPSSGAAAGLGCGRRIGDGSGAEGRGVGTLGPEPPSSPAPNEPPLPLELPPPNGAKPLELGPPVEPESSLGSQLPDALPVLPSVRKSSALPPSLPELAGGSWRVM